HRARVRATGAVRRPSAPGAHARADLRARLGRLGRSQRRRHLRRPSAREARPRAVHDRVGRRLPLRPAGAMRSLRTWLALGLALALAATAAAAAGGYLATRAWQAHRQHARLAAVKRLLDTGTVDAHGLDQQLSPQGVEAML